MAKKKDFGADNLLALNGDHYFVDNQGEFKVSFEVKKVTATLGKPLGLKYSLVLLNFKSERVVCFDNAIPCGKGRGQVKIFQNRTTTSILGIGLLLINTRMRIHW
jgi:hypothetical protein